MPQKNKKKFRVQIASEECKGCGRCIYSCPVKVLRMTDNVNKMGIAYAEYCGEKCIGCGACFYACPEPGAITVYEIKDEQEKE